MVVAERYTLLRLLTLLTLLTWCTLLTLLTLLTWCILLIWNTLYIIYDSNGKFDSIRLVCVKAQQLHEVGIRRTSFFFCNNFKDRTKEYRHVGFVSGP